MGQKAKLLSYLQTHDGITVLEAAYDLKVFCLHKRLSELEPVLTQMGYILNDEWETTSGGARVVRHRLERIAIG
jgi:hypothetical protein